jgi:hypothetical protein
MSTGVRIVVKIYGAKCAPIANVERNLAVCVVIEWFTLAFAYDAATGAYESSRRRRRVEHGHVPSLRRDACLTRLSLDPRYDLPGDLRVSSVACATKLDLDDTRRRSRGRKPISVVRVSDEP